MRKLWNLYSKLSLTTQIILTIILVFVSFFILQLFLNSVFFKNYYTEREIENFETKLSVLYETLESNNTDTHDVLYTFSQNENAITVVLDENMQIDYTQSFDFEVTIVDSDTDELYDVLVYGIGYDFSKSDTVSGILTEVKNNKYVFQYLTLNDSVIIDQPCDTNCIAFDGTITDVFKPDNINYLVANNPGVNYEIQRLTSGDIDLTLFNNTDTLIYTSDESSDTVVFLTAGMDGYLLTMVPIQNTASIIGIVSSYQNYVYLTAIVIIVLWSFRIGTIVSKPIKNVEGVAKEIANLNFDVEANEFQNKEAASLSNSINLMAKNLNDTIETINKKNDELMALYDEQTKQTSLKKQLVSSISHELKTPLMIMQVTIQGILDGIIPKEKQNDELHNLLEDINKSSLMIQDMLQIYRLEDKEHPLDLNPLNLGNITQYFINDFKPFIAQYELYIETKIDKDVIILGDEKLIKRVISNFITNAIKYTPKDKKIVIHVWKTENSAHFSIYNEGTQIDKKELKNIWMPFYRIETDLDNRLSSKGSGIGLYLVKEILTSHNFSFGIKNENDGVIAYFKAPLS